MQFDDPTGTLLVTGGAGFIGGNFVLGAVAAGARVVNLDALTYAGNLDTLAPLRGNPRHVFVHGDIGDRREVDRLLAEHRPRAIVNFAAESHVDRSIDGPAAFIQTNVVGTLVLLEAARDYWLTLTGLNEQLSASFTYRRTRCTDRWATTATSSRRPPTRQIHLTRRPRRPPITWFEPSTTPTACRYSRHTARTTTVLTSFRTKLIPLMILKAVAGEGLAGLR